MGYRELAQNLAAAAFRIAGDIPIDVVYVVKGAETYDPVTDVTTTVETLIPLTAVKSRPKIDEDDDTEPNLLDTKIIVSRKTLGVVAKNTDTIRFGGIEWEIVKSVSDPADAVYIFTVRAP